MSTPFAFSLKAQRELTIHLYCDILNLQAPTDLIVAYQPFKYRGYKYGGSFDSSAYESYLIKSRTDAYDFGGGSKFSLVRRTRNGSRLGNHM